MPFFNAPALSRRHIAVSTAVIAAHAAALWGLQHGLQQRPPDSVDAPVLLVDLTPAQPAPTKPAVAPQPAPPVPRPTTRAKPAPTPPAPVADAPAPAPAPAAPRATEAATTAPATGATGHTANVVPVTPATPAAPAAPPAPPAPPKIELPSTRADYLNNPKPEIPAVSRRLGEQGQVTLRVFIDTQGQPAQVEVLQSSGYSRLDEVARSTVLRSWRFVPGKRNGTPEAMWVSVPINFVLK